MIFGAQVLILFILGWTSSYELFDIGFLGNMLVGGGGTVVLFGALLAFVPTLMLIMATIFYGFFAWSLATNFGLSGGGTVLSVIGGAAAGFLANYFAIDEIQTTPAASAPSRTDSLPPPKDIATLELSALEDIWHTVLTLHEIGALSDKVRNRIFAKLQKTPNGIFLSETRKVKTADNDEFHSVLVNELMEYGLVSYSEANNIEIKAHAVDIRRKEQRKRKEIAKALYRLVGFRAIDPDTYRTLVKELDPYFDTANMTDQILSDIVALHVTEEPDDFDFEVVRTLLDYKLISEEECRRIGIELKSLRRV